MTNWNKISTLWSDLMRRRRISIFSSRDNQEMWYTHISPINLIMVFVASFSLIFIFVLTLVSYSPLLEILPGYRNKTLDTRRHIVESIVRIDSMERVINNMKLYSENVSLIMDGKRSEIEESFSRDTLLSHKEVVLPNAADLALRAQMEGEGRYGNNISYVADETMIMPVEGVVTRNFDILEEVFGVEINAADNGRVIAAQRGVVVMAHWTPSNDYIIEIMHPNNMLTIYRNIKSTVVKRGESVKAGEVIGYSYDDRSENQSNSAGKSDSRAIGFEIWSGGKPIDPQRYIVF